MHMCTYVCGRIMKENTCILGMGNICHPDVRVEVFLQNLLESLRVEAKSDP